MAKKRVYRPEGSRPVTTRKPPSAGGEAKRPSSAVGDRPPGPRPTRRQQFESASQPILARMALLPSFLLPMVLVVMMFLGLALPWWWAGLFLLSITAFLTWISALTWPAASPGSRALRVGVDLGLLALSILKLLGRF